MKTSSSSSSTQLLDDSLLTDLLNTNPAGKDTHDDAAEREKEELFAAKMQALDERARNLSFQSQPMSAALGRCLSQSDVRLSTSIHSFLSDDALLSNTRRRAGQHSATTRTRMANAPFPRHLTDQERKEREEEARKKKEEAKEDLFDLLDGVLDITESDDANYIMPKSASVPSSLRIAGTSTDSHRNSTSDNQNNLADAIPGFHQSFSSLQPISEEQAGMEISMRHDEIDASVRSSSSAKPTNNDSVASMGGSKSYNNGSGNISSASVFHDSVDSSLAPERKAKLEELLGFQSQRRATIDELEQVMETPRTHRRRLMTPSAHIPEETPTQRNMFAGLVTLPL